MEPRETIKLRFWQGAGQLAEIAAAADRWWERITAALSWLNLAVDPENCPLELLDLLAWQRDIDRLPNEPEELYRKRVKYALANAKDAGSTAGFARIWARLGLGELSQTERPDPVDWDVIVLEMDETIFARHIGLLDELVRQYGRTCRRYVCQSRLGAALELRSAGFDCTVVNSVARGF